LKRILEAFRAARKIEIVLVLVFIAVMAVIVLDKGNFAVSGANSEEMRLERLLNHIEGAGNLEVMLSGADGEYRSCVVVADGANDMRVVLKLQRAVQAALDIPLEDIEIIPSGG